MINPHRRWLYNKDEDPRIFEEGEEIPAGWYDSPAFDDPRTKKIGGKFSRMEENPTVKLPPEFFKKATPEEPPVGSNQLGKYPSQMNKSELLEHGKLLGMEFDNGMTKREMRAAINVKVLESGDGTE